MQLDLVGKGVPGLLLLLHLPHCGSGDSVLLRNKVKRFYAGNHLLVHHIVTQPWVLERLHCQFEYVGLSDVHRGPRFLFQLLLLH